MRTRRATPGPEVDQHLALADDRVVELADLVALRQVRVEVVLAVEAREAVDPRLQPQPGPHRLLDAEAVDHRQHARHRRVDQADVGVRLGPEGRRGAGEELGVRGDLGVHLEADHHLPVALGAGDDLRFRLPVGKLGHASVHRADVRPPFYRRAAPGQGGRKAALRLVRSVTGEAKSHSSAKISRRLRDCCRTVSPDVPRQAALTKLVESINGREKRLRLQKHISNAHCEQVVQRGGVTPSAAPASAAGAAVDRRGQHRLRLPPAELERAGAQHLDRLGRARAAASRARSTGPRVSR